MAGVPGIEPGKWQSQSLLPYRLAIPQSRMVEEGGFEPPNPQELIYSQPRLTASLLLQNCFKRMVDVDGIEPPTPAV